ncbi:MAG: DUF3343 domain-containing protein [Phoenicibacter congonensis]|uniref:DUF3343 domain-containing protein n=1 Tax=Phoenicibacter congonensis TaxID=1944646 RepID=A0AA43UAG1_9ACTN|nr:DUF3343 domain-containing protein [Phoenicibacter congonensis]
MSTKCYILVKSHTEGMALFEFLRANAFDARVAPSPRQAHSECGMSLLCDCETIDSAMALASENGLSFGGKMEVEQTFDIHRNKFC